MTFFAILACAKGASDADSALVDSTGATDTSIADTADTSATADTSPPRDLDGDGADDTLDCDDRDPERTPGATEAWDGVDNDCDGRVDADGTFTGAPTLAAAAIFEGRTYRFTAPCEAVAVRERRRLSLDVTCTPDARDADAQRMLGASLTVHAEDSYLDWTGTWTATAPLASASGWDTDADVRLDWPSADARLVQFAARVDAPFLAVNLAGDLTLRAR